jgi:hypothetical protein
MNFDLLSMAELTASAVVVALGFGELFGANLRERVFVSAAMLAWLAAVLWIGERLLLNVQGGFGAPGLGFAVAIPLALLLLVFLGSEWGRARADAASLSGLAALHAVRVFGGVTFVLLYAAGRLPAPFAPIAGWGDAFIGATALAAAWISTRRPDLAVLWNGLGMLDLVTAIVLGAMSAPGPLRLFMQAPGSAIMTTLPWIVIPCYLVPALAFAHLAALWRLLRAPQRRPAGFAV